MSTFHSPDRRWWWDGTNWWPAVSADGRAWWNGKRWVRARQRIHVSLFLMGLLFLLVLPVYALLTWAIVAGAPGTEIETPAQIAADERNRELAGRFFVVVAPALLVGGLGFLCAALVVRSLPLRPVRSDEASPGIPDLRD